MNAPFLVRGQSHTNIVRDIDVRRAHSEDIESEGCCHVAQTNHLLKEELRHQIHGHAVCKERYPRLRKHRFILPCLHPYRDIMQS